MDIDVKNKIESLRDNYSDSSVNYLKAVSSAIGAPEIYTGCFCKESSRVEFSKRFFMWFDTVKDIE